MKSEAQSDRLTPQTMRVTVAVEFDHHTLGRVQLSKATVSALSRPRDMSRQAERLRDESAGVVQRQLDAITSDFRVDEVTP